MHLVALLLGVFLPASSLGYVPYPARNFFFQTDNIPAQGRQIGQALFNAKAAEMIRDIAALQNQNTMQQMAIDANRIRQMQNNDAQAALIQANKDAAAAAATAAAAAATAAAAANTAAAAATLTRKKNY